MSGGWKRSVVSFGGSGLFTFAPGTWGSLAAMLALWGLASALARALHLQWHTGWNLAALIMIVLAGAACVALGPWTIAHFGKKDPGACVLDEVAGIGLTALLLPVGRWPVWIVALAVFVSFRVFDISKPPPARKLERLPAGWGILMDDLMAAVYANLACQLFLRLM